KSSTRRTVRSAAATARPRTKATVSKATVKKRASVKRGQSDGAVGKRPARGAARRAPSARRGAGPPQSSRRWLEFIEKHGVVLASARGPVPSIAEAVAGEPIIGSWWAHPKGKAIFAALSEIDDCSDVRCFKLVDGKVTFVHRRMWPALVRLAS